MVAAAVAAAAPAQHDGRPTARVGRIAEELAPQIDGRLDEACWRDAPALGDLTMVEPWEGRVPTQRTEVRLLHDRHALYIALWCFDRDAAAIRATQRARDARLDPDDRVEILLDPFENRRTVYFVQIGAGGSIGDILISQNGGRFDKPWDAVWSGASTVTADGWFAELAIPFRSLPRRDGADRWGFNLRRYVRTANEEYQWANPRQAVSFYRASECGTIEGFGAVDGGIGLEVVPYVSLATTRDRRDSDPDWRGDPDAGGEAYYRLTPSITLAATVATDFGQTENDDRQINLDRFPLFFPEKRDFFLDGAGYFTFGAGEAGGMRFLPFFTRRIGLAGDGSPIPLQWGTKLTGEAGPLELGLLDVQTDRTAALDRTNLAVGRVRYTLDEQTAVGVLATHGDPTGAGDNTVAGVDGYHRERDFVGDLDLLVTFDAMRSTGDNGGDDGHAAGVDVRSEGAEWEFGLGVREVAADFAPALGFVPRRGTRQSRAEAGWRPRVAEGSAVRRWLCDVEVRHNESPDGAPQDLAFELDALGVELQNDDEVALFASRRFTRVDEPFDLFRGTTAIAAGDYWASRAGLYVATSEARPWNVFATASTGDFFDGASHEFDADFAWRTSALLHLGVGYGSALVDLDGARSFTTQVVSGSLDLFVTPALSLQNLVLYDNESRRLGWQSRLRWIHAPGGDVFAVLGANWQRDDDGSLLPTRQELQLKIVQSLRF
ncbi:MAG: carbohydrate binding family 9 domain-containing protein [Planctomycetes bacterium]|nr:carbohydrate binding family 9 domain-containing protein [Planctomycetota bacterium]